MIVIHANLRFVRSELNRVKVAMLKRVIGNSMKGWVIDLIGIDIDLPKTCAHCKLIDHDREICAITKTVLIGTEYWTKRLSDCPLIELSNVAQNVARGVPYEFTPLYNVT